MVVFLALLITFVDLSTAQEPAQSQTPEATPTIDRLAPPPTLESPTQADEGAYLYWLNCQPCHGDQGQGLTDEWRAQYPPEDQNCWNSGCHGQNPYENGFTLPTYVPPVTGEGSLSRFQTLGQLYDYTRAAMPFEYPGALPDEEYLAIVAFLARAHGAWEGQTLSHANVQEIRLRAAADTQLPVATQPIPNQNDATVVDRQARVSFWFGLSFVGLLLLAGGVWAWRQRRSRQ